VAIGIDLEGRKEVLGLWTSGNEGAKFWLGVLTELRNCGVKDILIVRVDGLTELSMTLRPGVSPELLAFPAERQFQLQGAGGASGCVMVV